MCGCHIKISLNHGAFCRDRMNHCGEGKKEQTNENEGIWRSKLPVNISRAHPPLQTQVLKVPKPSRKVEELLASQVCFLLYAFRRQFKES